jgi:hypothetical protein
MPRFRVLAALVAAVALGACSDSQSPTSPSESQSGDELTFTLAPSNGLDLADTDSDADDASVPVQGDAGRGKPPIPQLITCVANDFHTFCINIRNSRLKSARADAEVTRSRASTRGQVFLNGNKILQTNSFGPVFPGDDIFAIYRNLNIRVFHGDVLCHRFKNNPTPPICGLL